MRKICALGFVGVFFVLLGGCALHYANNDEQLDLYLSTLDDKHFVWCKLDLEQCRKDFEEWKITARGRMIIREYEKEDTGQTYNTHHLPHVFRTRFLQASQFPEGMMEEQGKRQDFDQNSQEFETALPSIDENSNAALEGIQVAPQRYGPESHPNQAIHTEGS